LAVLIELIVTAFIAAYVLIVALGHVLIAVAIYKCLRKDQSGGHRRRPPITADADKPTPESVSSLRDRPLRCCASILAAIGTAALTAQSVAGADGPRICSSASTEQSSWPSSDSVSSKPTLRDLWQDPVIRGYIGLSENAWDFNAPETIPGFGPIGEHSNVSTGDRH
jgi:hypothetical protein